MSNSFDRGYACIIGVGADLPNTIKDAEGIANILTDPERCAYPQNQVYLRTGSEATRTGVLETLDHLASNVTAESTVLIYFSGHGYQFQSDFGSANYLLPYGYDLEKLRKTALSSQEFAQKLQAIPAQKLLVLLDCCHAGGFRESTDLEMAKAPLPPEAKLLFSAGGGRILIGSSRETELSYTGKPYSAFTTALVKGLCGEAASKQDGYVRACDLALYAAQEVPQLTKGRQHPVMDIQNADNFVMAYYAAGENQPKGLPFTEPVNIDIEGTENRQSQVMNTTTVTASGDRAVAIGHNSPGTIVTGDRNVVGSGNTVQQGNNNRIIQDNRRTQKTYKQHGKYINNFDQAENFRIGDDYYGQGNDDGE